MMAAYGASHHLCQKMHFCFLFLALRPVLAQDALGIHPVLLSFSRGAPFGH
jgi:hypothetical protein